MSIDIYPETARSNIQRESRLIYLAFALLCLTAAAMSIAPSARVGSWENNPIPLQHFVVLPAWALGVYLIKKSLQDHLTKRDPFLLPVAFLLCGWGLLILWRIDANFGARQTGWFLVASLGLLIILRAPEDLKWLRQYRYLWLLGGIFLIVLTLFFGTNPSGGEPRLWLGCCGVYFQPSEPLRLLLVAFLASYFADRLAFKWVKQQPSIVPMLGPLLIVWSISILLLFVQRDLGTGTLFLALLATLVFIATNRWQTLLVAFGLGLVGGIVGYASINIVETRLEAWIHPWADPTGSSYQLVQSLIGIASGGILGRGPGMGAPGFVPAAHTDFIFTALSEEWGLIGSIALLTLFAIFISRGIKVARHLHDPFDKMLASGVSLAFGLQTILIIGGVTRLLPLTGITLPFVSYGGSSLLTSFLALGLLVQLSNKTSPTLNDLGSFKFVYIGINIGWVLLSLTAGWWAVIRSQELTFRTDNPRRAYVERFEERGRILDRNNIVLSESIGSPGDFLRTYVFSSFSSVIGYDSAVYGTSGLEKSMDLTLRGEAVYNPFVIAWSNVLQSHPPPGLDIRLTLDSQIQNDAYEILGDIPGAIVVFEPSSGDILAMVSSPSFNSNNIDQDWESLISRTDAPLLNRATQSQYQPGMVFTPFLAAWGLEHDMMDLYLEVENATSPFDVHGELLQCSSSPPITHSINGALALKLGCPSYFADFGSQLSVEAYIDIAQSFRFTETPAIRIDSIQPDELVLPSTTEEMKLASIGQATLTFSPIQVARAFGALLNAGVLPAFRLVDAVESPEGGWEYLPSEDSPLTASTPQAVQSVMSSSRKFDENIQGFSFQAIAGPEQARLHWFLGVKGENRAIVVVLEGEDLESVEGIGISILNLY